MCTSERILKEIYAQKMELFPFPLHIYIAKFQIKLN